MQFTPIIVTIASTPYTFGAESLTPQETHLRDMTSDRPYNALQTVKVGFSAPNVSRPTSFTMSRVYKTPISNELGAIVGILRTDVKTTVPLTATLTDRQKHFALVSGMESAEQVINQGTNLVSWY